MPRMTAWSAVNHLHQPTKLVCPAWHEARARHLHGSRIQGRKQATEMLSALWSSNRVSSVHETTRSEEHTSELQSLMRISYAVFCLNKQQTITERTYLHTQYTTLTTSYKTNKLLT